MRKTKIIATIGPATSEAKEIKKLIEAGVDFFRFNLKYSSIDWHNKKIATIRKLAKSLKKPTGIIVDVPRADFTVEIKDFDFVALSYLKTAQEVIDLRARLDKRGKSSRIIAKIENGTAMENVESIVKASDAVMVARGDLGREMPIKELGYFQKKIIDKCREFNKPVIVATEMLLSMTENVKPTRAEATDVSNAVFDGTDALMLSEETAIGKHPIEAVKTMSEIADFCETTGELRKINKNITNLTESLMDAATRLVKEDPNHEIKTIVVFTKTGNSARMVSRYRLEVPIIAISDDEENLRTMNLSFGVFPYLKEFKRIKFENEDPIFEELCKAKLIKKGEQVLLIHGNNWLLTGSTNQLSIRKA